jgi:DnaJ homolog subfamily C member 7
MESESSSPTAEELRLRGNGQHQAGNYVDAIRLYTESIALSASPQAYGNRAACYVIGGDMEAAAADCESALSLDPSYTKATFRLGKVFLLQGELEKARRYLDVAEEAAPGCSINEIRQCEELSRTRMLAPALIEQDRIGEVLGLLTRAGEIAPFAADIAVLAGEAHFKKKDGAKVMEFAQKVLRRNPRNVDGLFLRGSALLWGGNMPQAVRHFEIAVQMDPENARAISMLKIVRRILEGKEEGDRFWRAQNFEEAMKMYSKAIDADGGNLFDPSHLARIHSNRAACLQKLKKFEEALSDCDAAIELDPGFHKAMARRAAILVGLERFEEASYSYEALCREEPSNREYRRSLRDAKQRAKVAQRKDYYKTLGIEKAATKIDVKKAYRKMAMRWHPDRFVEATPEEKKAAEDKFKDIAEAYSVLSDEDKRARYDDGADLQDIESGPRGGFGGGGIDPFELFSMFGGGGGGMGGFGSNVRFGFG